MCLETRLTVRAKMPELLDALEVCIGAGKGGDFVGEHLSRMEHLADEYRKRMEQVEVKRQNLARQKVKE